MQQFSLVYNNLFVFLEPVDELRPTYDCGQLMQGSSSGQKCAMGLGSILIHFYCEYRGCEQLPCTPKMAYDNYMQDCLSFKGVFSEFLAKC